ncbi:hypothetical protein B2J93_6868 [Marssonina coronariae]|uniref:Uncharacterized protein n=1 Tax=Diplocarpon coronariae TaxID=2795749 RepID=A0A218YWG8_9HELO|nr:hypothetical protein B2J93_6868 [Marssonina coronariae]
MARIQARKLARTFSWLIVPPSLGRRDHLHECVRTGHRYKLTEEHGAVHASAATITRLPLPRSCANPVRALDAVGLLPPSAPYGELYAHGDQLLHVHSHLVRHGRESWWLLSLSSSSSSLPPAYPMFGLRRPALERLCGAVIGLAYAPERRISANGEALLDPPIDGAGFACLRLQGMRPIAPQMLPAFSLGRELSSGSTTLTQTL